MAADIQWCKIPQSGLLEFEGSDAQSFLQGQLTNNVAALAAGHSQYTGYCTPKGRLVAVMLLWCRDGTYHMVLARELCEAVRKRLAMYILRAKVKAVDRSADYCLFGMCGADAPAMAGALAGAAPEASHQAVHGNAVTVINLPVERFLLVAPVAHASRIEAALADTGAASDASLWSALDIAAGIPSVAAATQEQFVPQTVNFDLIHGVSFDKGCYTGQEIVARTHFLGKLKQRMVRARVASAEAPVAGDKLYSERYGDQASGMIVSAVSSGTDQYDVLAVIQTSDFETAAVHCKTPAGPTLQWLPLPYALK